MSFNYKRYGDNLIKVVNRTLCALTGGDPEMTNSARLHRLQATRTWARVLRRVVDSAFKLLKGETDHCAKASDREDDKGTYAADPLGQYWVPLVALWVVFVVWLVEVHL